MKPAHQTKLHDPDNGVNGNCLAACLASLLEIPLDIIPKFEDMMVKNSEDWFEAFTDWLDRLGFTILTWESDTWLPGYYLASGMSERGNNHIVIYKGGELAHDPHPSRTGIKKINQVWALLPFDPASCYYNHKNIIT